MKTKPGMMPLLDGTEMPRYGFGCYASYGHEISQAVAWALECGYRYIDSAAMYANEKDVGEGLRLAGLDRKKVYILSKVWPPTRPNSPSGIWAWIIWIAACSIGLERRRSDVCPPMSSFSG